MSDDKIVKILEEIQAGQKALQTDVASLKDGQQKQGKQIDMLVDTAGHINTALKVVATKHDVDAAKSELGARISDVEAKVSAVEGKVNEVRSDVLRLDSKVVKKNQSYERRITNLEEQSGIENPEKH
jgi:hypothetical protein